MRMNIKLVHTKEGEHIAGVIGKDKEGYTFVVEPDGWIWLRPPGKYTIAVTNERDFLLVLEELVSYYNTGTHNTAPILDAVHKFLDSFEELQAFKRQATDQPETTSSDPESIPEEPRDDRIHDDCPF